MPVFVTLYIITFDYSWSKIITYLIEVPMYFFFNKKEVYVESTHKNINILRGSVELQSYWVIVFFYKQQGC